MFVSAQTEINFIIMKDFLKSNFDSIKGSISVESIFSQTCSFMIAITAIHWSMTHCNNPWPNVTMLICLFQVSFDELNFSGILWESQTEIDPWTIGDNPDLLIRTDRRIPDLIEKTLFTPWLVDIIIIEFGGIKKEMYWTHIKAYWAQKLVKIYNLVLENYSKCELK